MMANGEETLGRGQVFKSGLMGRDMKVTGSTIELQVRESSFTSTETSTQVIGKMTRPTAMEYIFTTMAHVTKAIGRMITRMAMVWKSGPTKAGMRGITRRVEKTDKEHTHGLTVVILREIGSITK